MIDPNSPQSDPPFQSADRPAGERFLREHHLRRGQDFQRVYARRVRASDGVLLVFAAPNDLGYSRVGLSVSRKVGAAVVRNRWKRMIREAFRLSQSRLPVGLDLVVIPRAEQPPTLDELLKSLPKLATRLQRMLRGKK